LGELVCATTNPMAENKSKLAVYKTSPTTIIVKGKA
jgi:hypothetical protein